MSDPYSDDPWRTDTPTEAPPADPWAAEPPADEAQSNVPAPTPTKESHMTETSQNARIVTTIKYGAGFDAPWTVIHSDSVDEAKATLNSAKDLLELTAKVAKYAKTLDSGTAPAAPRGGNGGGQRQQQSPPPGVDAKTCQHGEMVFRTGNGAKGPWKAFFCPQPKDAADQCKPLWVK